MCEPTPVYDTGKSSDTEAGTPPPIRHRPNWPFLHYQHNGKLYRNPIKRITQRQKLANVEDALL